MFQQPLDIINRGLQRCGLPRMGSLMDQQPGQEMIFEYDKLRRAELRRNLWVFATRTGAIRALDTTSRLLNFPAYAAGTTYPAGYVVTYGNLTWISLIDANLGNTPGTAATSGQLPWDNYYGTPVANAWNDSIQNTATTNNISYHVGEIAYYLTTGNIYVSVVDGNQNDPTVVDTWSATTMYSTGAVVSFTTAGGSLTNHQSLGNLNFASQPDTTPSKWPLTHTNT